MSRELIWFRTTQRSVIGYRLVVDGETAGTGVMHEEFWPGVRDGFKADSVVEEEKH